MTDIPDLPEQRRRGYRRRENLRKIKRRRILKRRIVLFCTACVIVIVTGGFMSTVADKIERREAAQKTAREAEAKEKAEAEAKKQKEEEAKRKEEKQQVVQKTLEEEIVEVKQAAGQAGCPPELIGLIDKNAETIDFVRNYAARKDVPPAQSIEADLANGGIPQLLQWDERWGYAPYGTSTIAASGCGPTCMAMVVAGLTQDASVTPYTMAKFSEENKYLDETNNTYWLFMNEAAKAYGINCVETAQSEATVQSELAKGNPIICSVWPGDFTQVGHFIVLTGYAEGKVRVNDPFSRVNSEKEWVYSEIAGQIREMWIYSR